MPSTKPARSARKPRTVAAPATVADAVMLPVAAPIEAAPVADAATLEAAPVLLAIPHDPAAPALDNADNGAVLLTSTPLDSAPSSAPVAVPVSFARREAAVLAAIYPAANVKPRDLDYLAFYSYLATLGGGTFTVGDMLANAERVPGTSKRRNPLSAQPSAPAADAGAHNRAEAFGHIYSAGFNDTGAALFKLATRPDDAATGPASQLRINLDNAKRRADAYKPA
jgi:hypothetical protein